LSPQIKFYGWLGERKDDNYFFVESMQINRLCVLNEQPNN